MIGIDTILAWSPARKLLVSAVGAAVLMAAGAAAWDRTPVIGPHAKITALRRQIDDPIKGLRRQLDDAQAYGANRETARRACEDKRRDEGRARSDAIDSASSDKSKAASAAFDNGYAAGRVVGRRQCGGSNVPTGSDPIGDALSRGLRDDGKDLASDWNASAYRPGGALP